HPADAVPQVIHVHQAPPDRTVQRLALGSGPQLRPRATRPHLPPQHPGAPPCPSPPSPPRAPSRRPPAARPSTPRST
ncbi:DUF6251 family protein, partial [Streptomyces rubiginosohelvolus]